jgi:hexosaminidase
VRASVARAAAPQPRARAAPRMARARPARRRPPHPPAIMLSMQRVACLLVLASGHTTTATTVWPAPASMSTSNATVKLSSDFAFTVTKGASSTLTAAVQRATKALAASGPLSPTKGGLSEVKISVASAEDKLKWGVDESYSLKIIGGTSVLSAPTVFGAMHGLRTFLQLADEYGPRAQPYLQVPSPLTITDAPRFKWRGLMIDTGKTAWRG